MKKQSIYQFLAPLALVTIFAFSFSINANFDLSQFDPQPGSTLPLPEGQYSPVRAHFLRDARILWVNWDLFRQYGIELGNELTPELEQALLEQFAYGVISPDDDQNKFDLSKPRTMYSDYYGGVLRGKNLGSGRAASFLGNIRTQSKGLGKIRAMVRQTSRDHSNGKAPLLELIREVIYGEFNHSRLPHGSNRVFVLMDRGTKSVNHRGEELSDAIVIREDPVRPAHFMNLDGGISSPHTRSGQRFNSESLQELRKLLGNDLNKGLEDYVKKIAGQYAHAFTLNIYHGATSPSNIEINGRFLDYGTQTLQTGHARVQILDHVEPAGETQQIVQYLVRDFIQEVQQRFQLDLHRPISHFEELFKNTYQEQLKKGFLALLGFAKPQTDFIYNTYEGRQLADLVEEIATLGQVNYIGRFNPPSRVTELNISQIIEELITDRLTLGNYPSAQRTNFENLVQKYSAVLNRLEERYGLNFRTPSQREKQIQRAQILNRVDPELLRWNRFTRDSALTEEYSRSQNPNTIQSAIQDVVRRIQTQTEILRRSGSDPEPFVPARNRCVDLLN